MGDKTKKLLGLLQGQAVIPVLVIEDPQAAVPLAEALVAGGLKAIEVTLRTPDALKAIKAMAREVEGVIVGAGTILNALQYRNAVEAGARFVVSPGTTVELLDYAKLSEVPFLPGAGTPSEMMALRDEGYQILKFFPAELSGGAGYLKALSSPLADMRFCPTGGIGSGNAGDYLKLPNVVCVGGSWVAPADLVAARDWPAITELARAANRLGTAS